MNPPGPLWYGFWTLWCTAFAAFDAAHGQWAAFPVELVLLVYFAARLRQRIK